MMTETDQRHCYDAAGRLVDCRGAGQDGGRQRAGALTAATRFDADGGGVTDLLTGLTWARSAALSGFPMTWAEAFDAVESLHHLSYGDTHWRLPSRRELFSLISHQSINPALPAGHPFADVFSGYYWTRTPCARLPGQAWYVHLGGGKVYRGMKHGAYMVWPVSGPPYGGTGGGHRFAVDGDIARDRLTGLEWYSGGGLTADVVTWQAALEAVQRFNAATPCGHADWRLPGIRELDSIVDDARHSPAFADTLPFSGGGTEGYWSSTTSVYEPRYAWVLYARDGAIGVGFKPNAEFGILAVRGGRRSS